MDSGVPVEIEAEIKAERCDQETIHYMRFAGVRGVEIGLQSVKDATLDVIKRKNNLEKVRQAVRWLTDEGIEVYVDTIIALPGESLADWFATIDYCFSLGEVAIFSNTLKILPNSEMHAHSGEFGLAYERWRQGVVTSTREMTREDISLARLHQKMIKFFWNRSSSKRALTDVIRDKYRGRLSLFTAEAMRLLSSGENEAKLTDTTFWQTHAPTLPHSPSRFSRQTRIVIVPA